MKYCTGLDLSADDPMKMIGFDFNKINSMKMTWNNLKAEASGHDIKNNDKLLRYNALVHWVEGMRDGGDVTITADMLAKYWQISMANMGKCIMQTISEKCLWI